MLPKHSAETRFFPQKWNCRKHVRMVFSNSSLYVPEMVRPMVRQMPGMGKAIL